MHNDPPTMANVASQNTVVDDGVGKVLAALDKRGLAESTLVIFSSDQGNFYGQHGLWQHTVVTKPANLYEAAMNIPLIVRHKGKLKPGVNTRLIGQYDLPVTLLDYLDIPVQFEGSPGRSFAGQLRGEKGAWAEEVFYEQEETRGIRTPEFAFWKRLKGTGNDALYDMRRDPGQHDNLAEDPDYQATIAALSLRLAEFFAQYSDRKYDLWQGGVAKGSMTRPGTFRALYGEDWAPRTDRYEPFTEGAGTDAESVTSD